MNGRRDKIKFGFEKVHGECRFERYAWNDDINVWYAESEWEFHCWHGNRVDIASWMKSKSMGGVWV